MILNKLKEALDEVLRERAALDEVEKQLKAMIAGYSNPGVVATSGAAPVNRTLPSAIDSPSPLGERDRIDEMADLLREQGSPQHITVITDLLNAKMGKSYDRRALEPGLNRHIAKAKQPRIAKFGPSIFGLPEWKSQDRQSAFAQIA